MDFITRDRYRHVVEALARQSGVGENSVAHAAIQLATEAVARDGPTARTAHVGFYLIDKGRPQLERIVRVRWSFRRSFTRLVRQLPTACYVGSVLSLTAAAASLADLPPVKGRGVRRRIALGDGAVFTLIDESYNASPAAMEAAIAVAGAVAPSDGGRRIAVLGDMRELGVAADGLHAALAAPLIGAGFDLVFCCGSHMRALYGALPVSVRGGYAEDAATLAPLVTAAVGAGDVVLVKGSAGSRMAGVVAALVALENSRAAVAVRS